MKPRLALGKLLPAITLGAGCLGALLVLLVSFRISQEQVRNLTDAYLMNVGYAFASSLQSDMRNRDLSQVRSTIQRASSSGVADTAMLFDDDGKVLYSTMRGFAGLPLVKTPFSVSAPQLSASRSQMQPIRALSEDGQSLIVMIPVRLWPREGELIALRTGMLGLSFDIEPWLALTYSSVRSQALIFLLFAASLSALIAWLIQSLVTRRVGRLVEATGQIAQGNFEAAVQVSGRDEIALLSTAIESMSKQLKTSMTDLAEGEELLQRIINNSPEAIYLAEPGGRMLMMNRVFREWMGIDENELTQPQSTPELHEALNEMNRAVVEGASEIERELLLHGAQGKARFVRFRKFPVRDAQGELLGVGTIGNDVTSQRDTENQLRHAQKMEAVGQLTGGLAHDFNNILQAIVGNLELLKVETDEQHRTDSFLHEAIEAADRGRRLTQRLLATSRRQILQPEVLCLNSALDSMEDLIRSTIGEQIALDYRCEASLWNCEADISQTENAILNLAINARDAMPTGGTLIIETANVQIHEDEQDGQPGLPPGSFVRLSASDSGHGMTEEVRERAFEPFFSTKNEGGGSGLGLSTIYGFVRQSGGEISLTSVPDQGTTVSLYLPRSHKVIGSQRQASESPAPMGEGQTVLLVEDNPQVRKMTSAMLTDLGYAPITAETAKQAMCRIEAAPDIEIVLSDVILPGGMTGIELAKEVKTMRPELQIQLMSGFVADALDHSSLDNLAAPLQKPFRRTDLARALNQLVKNGQTSSQTEDLEQDFSVRGGKM